MDKTTWEALHCSLTVTRPAEGLVLLVFAGTDIGELADRPFVEMARDLEGGLPIEVWIDARATAAASMDVSSGWADWLATNRRQLHQVTVLSGSNLLAVTVAFAARYSGLGSRMRIFRHPAAFDSALAAACDPGAS